MPPLVGVAVKVTPSPEHTGLALAAIVAEGVTFGVTPIVIQFDFAVGEVTQLALEVIIQHTTSPLFSPGIVIGLPLPAVLPLTVHR